MEYYHVDKFNRRPKSSTNSAPPTPTTSLVAEGITLEPDGWNAKKRKITNTEKGSKAGDVTTFDQTLTHTPTGFTHNGEKYTIIKNNEDLDMNGKRIKNVSVGRDKNDAVVLSQIMANNGRFWEGKNMQIGRIKYGTSTNDAVNYGQYLTSLRLTKGGKTYSAENKNITNVLEGVLPNDAAVVKQIPTDYIKSVANKWDSRNQPIINVQEGAGLNEVVTVRQTITSTGQPHIFSCGMVFYDLTSLKK